MGRKESNRTNKSYGVYFCILQIEGSQQVHYTQRPKNNFSSTSFHTYLDFILRDSGKINGLEYQIIFSLFFNKMSAIRAGIHKMLVGIANREDPDQTASSEAV